MDDEGTHILHVNLLDTQGLAELEAFLTDSDELDYPISDSLEAYRESLDFDELWVEPLDAPLQLSIAFHVVVVNEQSWIDLIGKVLTHWGAKTIADYKVFELESELVYEEGAKQIILWGRKANVAAREKFGVYI